ncbi:MAG: sel1 repeat family protein [Deltaproteobacteria bacterium]|nr:sel1 repeat family protein [Deltaproteobacteria bacterium]
MRPCHGRAVGLAATLTSLLVLGFAATASAAPACAPADRLPACQADAALCFDALKQTPQGDPVQLACTAEAACLAGRAGACGAVLQFLAQAGFGRDLRARAADYEAHCEAKDKGACTVYAALLDERAKSAPPDEAAQLKIKMVRVAARACAQGMDCARLAAMLDGGVEPTAEEEGGAALEAACKSGADAAACAWVHKKYGDLTDAGARRAKCKEGVARACAVEAAEQKLASGDPEPWWNAACQAGDCAACVLRLRDDKGRMKVGGDDAKAVAARTTCAAACSKGRMSACNQVHDLAMSGVGGPRDESAAVTQRLPLCQADAAACPQLATAWIVTPALPVDDAVTARLAQVCKVEKNHGLRQPACQAPAERTALRGDRVKCAGGDDATCLRLGRRLRDLGLHAQAADVLGGACDRQRADACAALADVRHRGIDLPPLGADAEAKLKATAKKACEGGDAEACYDLAQSEDGQGSAAAKKALQLLATACKQGNGPACRMGADLCEGYGRKLADDPKRAMGLRESGCKAGDARSCVLAGKQADEDSENPASGEKSGPLYLRACTLGDADGCVRLARTSPAQAQAAAALAAACKAGVLDVCRE